MFVAYHLRCIYIEYTPEWVKGNNDRNNIITINMVLILNIFFLYSSIYWYKLFL